LREEKEPFDAIVQYSSFRVIHNEEERRWDIFIDFGHELIFFWLSNYYCSVGRKVKTVNHGSGRVFPHKSPQVCPK